MGLLSDTVLLDRLNIFSPVLFIEALFIFKTKCFFQARNAYYMPIKLMLFILSTFVTKGMFKISTLPLLDINVQEVIDCLSILLPGFHNSSHTAESVDFASVHIAIL